ncbi:DivIVA domain-containing protein [Tsukamurella pseudospumae]|uniref:Cell division protein DivIVA n=1 Tax=Tsukamurella pseudospumae TaxID=239498 RepID=A0A138A0S0_9ACTN|nr:DivIVA domain-containing protein [Tsukamurella pseudospumae]KXO88893.1 cell division protein DivIVA [Tsukamurella pseudospumae]KXP04026.1 cell division protein DivIVA [Tsukamurella pseudospumae]
MVIVLYALGLLAVAAVLYGVAALVFGRGDETPPLETGATPTVLPAEDVAGADVRALRFQQVVRGYKPAEVDWALERLAREIDVLRARLAAEPESRAAVPEDSEGRE